MGKTVEIVLCDSCCGKGYVLVQEMVDHHRGDYETTKQDCHRCNKSGRLRKTTTVEVEPYA